MRLQKKSIGSCSPAGCEAQHSAVNEMSSFDKPIVFGAPYSVYVRTVRLALEEKGIAYELVPVDIFVPDGPPPEHMMRHPFGKIPAFEHAGFRLYEAGAITRYIDEAFG